MFLRFRNIILFLGLFLLLLSCISMYISVLSSMHFILLLGALLMIFLGIVSSSSLIQLPQSFSSFSFMMMSIFFFIAGIINIDYTSILLSFLIFSIWFVFSLIRSADSFSYNFLFKIFPYAVLSLYIVFVVISLIANRDVFSSHYKGVMMNPNSMGLFSSFVFAISISLMFMFIISKKTKKYRIFIVLVSLTISFFLTIFSSSRSSILSIFMTSIVFILLIVFKKRPDSSSKFNIFIGSFIFVIFAIIILRYTDFIHIFDDFIAKNLWYYNSGNFDNGRSYIWEQSLSDFSFFGNGRLGVYLDDHNTYLSLLRKYGFFSMIFFAFFLFGSLIKFGKYVIVKKDYLKAIIPLFIAVSIIPVSFVENVFWSSGIFACLLYLQYFERDLSLSIKDK